MSSGGRGSYSIRIDLDASQALATINQLKSQFGSLGPTLSGVSGQINQASMSFERYNTAAQKTVGTSSSLASGLGQLRGPLGQLNSQINTTAATLPKLAAGQNQAAAASQKSAAAMQGQIQRMTALGSRIGGIAFMFTGLTAAMGEAQGMQSLLAESQAKLTSQQEKAKNAVEKYGKGSFQATRALEQLEKAERAVAFQSRITTLSIQDQFFFIGGLASIALPSVIQGIGKLVQSMKAAQAAGQGFGAALSASFAGLGSKFTGVINAMTAGLNRLVPSLATVAPVMGTAAASTAANATALSTYTVATGAATAGTRTFSVALTGLLRHPVVLIIAALATAFIALQQNVFGVTDRIREFGIALGQALPILQPLLNLIDGLAATLGITGEAAVDASERFRTAFEGFGNLSSLWHDTLAGMQRSESDIVRFFGNVGVVISDFVVNAGEQFKAFAQSMIVDWNEVIPQIQSALEGLGAWFSDFFTRLPGTLADIGMKMLETLGIFKLADMIASNPVLRQMGEAIMSFVDYVQDVSADIIKKLGLDKVAAEIGKAMEGAAKLVSGTAPSGNIPKPGEAPGSAIQDTSFVDKMVQEATIAQRIKSGTVFKGPKGFLRAAKPFGAPQGAQTIEDLQKLGVGQDQFTKGVLGARQLPTRPPGTGGITPTDLPAAIDAMRTWRKENESIASESKKWWAQMGAGTKPMQDLEQELRILQDDTGAYHQEAEITPEIAERIKAAQEEYNKVFKETNSVTKAQEAAQKVLNQGYATTAEEAEKVETVMSELVSSNDELQKSYLQTGEAAMSGNLALEMQRQGMLEAGQAALNYGMELEKNTAFNKVWGEIIDTNAFKQAAFATGVQNQVAELNKQKVAVAENVGALAEYARQVESGEAGQVAFTRGVQTQQKSLLDSKVALSEGAGALQEYFNQIASGEQQQVAFARGAQEVGRALGDSVVNIHEMEGALSQLDVGLRNGVQQQVAFNTGFVEGRTAAREWLIEMHNATGEAQGLMVGMQEVADMVGIQIPAAFSQSAERMKEWIGVTQGLEPAVSSLADRFLELGAGLSDMVENIELDDFAKDVDDSIEEIADSFEEMADDLGLDENNALIMQMRAKVETEQMLGEFKKIAPLLTNAIQSNDVEGRQAVSNWLKDTVAEATEDATPQVQDAGRRLVTAFDSALAATKGTPAFRQSVLQVVDALDGMGIAASEKAAIMHDLGTAIGSAELQTEALKTAMGTLEFQTAATSTAVGQLIAEISKFSGTSPEQFAAFSPEALNLVQKQIADYQAGISKPGVTQGPTAPKPGAGGAAAKELAGIEPQIARIQQMLSLLGPAAQQAVGQMSAAFAALDLTGFTEKLRLGLEPLSLLGPATTEAIAQVSAAFTSLDLTGFTEKLRVGLEPLSLLGPAVTEAVAQMSAAFAALDLTGFTEKLRIGLEPLTLLGPATQQAVAQMSAAFASIDLTGFLAALQPIHETLALLGPATQQAVAQMVAAFVAGTNQMITALQGVGNMVTQTAARFPEIGTAAQTAAQTVNAATNTMITALQGVQNMAAQTAQSFAQIGDAANAAAQVVNSATNTMITALQGVISMADQVADSIAGIGAAAQAAESDVQALSSAIENIPDGDAVIRVTYDVAPAPSGITAAGVGLGFSRSGTVTYTASGGSGGGGGGSPTGGGGGLSGGPSFGGGGEPSLQFGAQGGLGRAAFDHKSGEFNRLGILAPALIDHPTKLLVGENGPELVSVTPVNRYRHGKTGEISPFVDKRTGRPLAAQGGLGYGEFHTMGDTPAGAGFAGTINFGQGVVQFRDSGPIQVNVMQGTGGVGGGGIGTGIPTTGGGFPTFPGQQFPGQGLQQGTFNVPGGQVSVSGNAVACVNGQCFGNMAGFGPGIGQPPTAQPIDLKPFEPVIKEGMIDAIETLKAWFKYLGIPLGGIGGAGLTTEDIMKNYNPFRPTFEGGMFPGFGFGGFGMGTGAFAGGGGAAAAAGGGGAMAMAGGAMAFAGRGFGGFPGGGGGYQPTPLPGSEGPHGNPMNWVVAQEAGPDGKWNGKYLVFNMETQRIVAKGFTTQGWAEQYIVLYRTGAVPVPLGGGTGGFGFPAGGGFGQPPGGLGGAMQGGYGGGGFGGMSQPIGYGGAGEKVLVTYPDGSQRLLYSGHPDVAKYGGTPVGGGGMGGGYGGGAPTQGGGSGTNWNIQGNPAAFQTPFFQNFFGAGNVPGGGAIPQGGGFTGGTMPQLGKIEGTQVVGGGRIKPGGWGGNMANPMGWKVVPTRDKKWGNFKVVDEKGINIADMFMTEQGAQQFIAAVQQGMMQTMGGGLPTMPGGGMGGGGNFQMQGNPALLNTPFFNNFFGGNNPFAPGGGGGFGGGNPFANIPGIPTGNIGTGGFGGGLPTGGAGGCSICGAASSLQGAAGDLSGMFGGMAGNGSAMAMGNAVACVNGQCFGNMQGFGPGVGGAPFGGQPGGGNTFQGPLPPGMTPEQFVQQFMSGQFGGQGGVPGQIQMTGGQIVFDANQGEVEMRTSTGAIAIAGPGGAFATAGRATAGVGLFGQGPTTAEQQQLNQLQQMNQNLNNLNGQLGQQGEMIEFQQQQQQQFQEGIFGGVPGFGGAQPVMFQQQGGPFQQFNAPGFTGFGQSFQQFPGGGAVGSGTNDPLGFLNSMLGGFGIPTPAGIPGGGGVPGGVTAPGVGGGTGGVGCDVCGAIRSLGSVGGGGGTGGGGTLPGGGGGTVPNPGGGGAPGEPGFIGGGGGGGIQPPAGGGGGPGTTPPAPGQTTPGCRFHCRPMDSDPNRYRIDDAQGNESNGGVYYDTALACNQRLQELCPTSGSPGNNMNPAPTQPPVPYQPPNQQPPGGGYGQPPGGAMQTGGGRAVAIAGGGMLGGTPVVPTTPGMPIGNPPVPPRIVQEAGLPSQHVNVNQDPASWRIVESAGLVGTYDIIDNNGDVVQLGFRTMRDAEVYLNYFISYYKWVKSGSTGIPGPVPVGGGTGGGYGGGTGGGTLPGGGYGGGGYPGQFPGGLPSDFEGQFPTAPGQVGIGGNLTGGGYGGRPAAPPPTPPPINILEPEMTTPTATTAEKIEPANVDARTWKIAQQTRPDGIQVYFVVVTIQNELTYITDTPFATQADAQKYIDYWKAYQLHIATPPQTFPPPGTQLPGIPTGGGMPGGGFGGVPGVGIGGGGVTATAGNASASAGMGGAFAQAGGAIASAGGMLGGNRPPGPTIPRGPTTEPEAPFEPIPRAQGPFRSGQDNMEPIYDNSGVKIGADFGSPGDTMTMEDVEEGGGGGHDYGGRGRRGRRGREFLERVLARAGYGGADRPPWVGEFFAAFERMMGDLMINLTVNSYLDGAAIHRNQNKYALKKVSVFA